MDELDNQLVAMGGRNESTSFPTTDPNTRVIPFTPASGATSIPTTPTAEEQRRAGVPSLQQQFVSPAMPEEWGGRPKGTSRRARRMQAEWDEEQKRIIDRQQALQQMRDADQRFEFNLRDQMIQEETYGFSREASIAEQKLKAQQASEAKQLISSINDLDPYSPEFYDNLIRLRRQFPMGATDPTVVAIIGDYEKVNSLYVSSQKETENEALQQKESQDKLLREAAKVTRMTGRDLSDVAYSDPNTGELVVDQVKLGELEAEAAAKPVKDLDAPTLRQEAKEIRGEIRKLNDDIISAKAELESAGSNKKLRDAAATRLITLQRQIKAKGADLQGVESLLSSGEAQPQAARGRADNNVAVPAAVPTAKNLSAEQIDAARMIAQNPNHPRYTDAVRFLEKNQISIDGDAPIANPTPQADVVNPTPVTEPTTPQQPPQPAAQPRREQPSDLVDQRRREQKNMVDRIKEIGSESMARDFDDVAMLDEELNRLNRLAYRFSPNKRQRDLYAAVAKQRSDTLKSLNEERRKLINEKRKRMKAIGPFSGSKEFDRLSREVDILSSV